MSTLTHFHTRIADKIRDCSQPTVIIVALGDSVTAGAGLGEILHDDVYHAQLKKLLEKQYPHCVFSVVNAGDNGQTATGGIERFERDVPHHRPDLVIIAYGINDATGDLPALPAYAEAIETLIRRTKEATDADLILVTPTMMPHYDNGKIPSDWAHVTELFLHLQRDGVLAQFAQVERDLAEKYGVALANVYGKWEELEASGVATTEMLVNGLNHPDAHGHRIAAECIFNVIESGKPEFNEQEQP